MKTILAIDQGTSSTRAMLYSLKGDCLRVSQYPLLQSYPNPGWVEQDPEEIWNKTLKAMREVVEGIDPQTILACGISNQRETTVIWDKKTGQCLAPALVWQDRRTQDFCDSLKPQSDIIHHKTGLLPDPYFSASKLNWLLKEKPYVRKLALENRAAFGTIDSFLIWRLTAGGEHFTDITNASRTMLFNINSEQWDEELLHLFAIPKSMLPEVKASDAYFGKIDSSLLGFSIPITGVAGDQQAALIGQGCIESGMVKATFGTGGFLMLNTGKKPVFSKHRLLTTIAYKIQGKTIYALEGSLYQAGTIIKWLRDEMKFFVEAGDSELFAENLSDNGGVYLIPSFTGLGAPHWLNTKGAVMVGLSRTTTPAHFARAALECVCYQTRDLFNCLREDSKMALSTLRVDGGMSNNQWFLRFLSVQCAVTVERPRDIETTALGAAMLAAIGCGAVESLNEFRKKHAVSYQFSPRNEFNNFERDYQGWQNALQMVK